MSATEGLHGRLSESLDAMLRYRESAGLTDDTHRYLLSPFLDYVAESWDAEPLVTPEIVDGWLGHHRYESPSSQYCFIACLRGLCRFTRFEGHDDFVPDEAKDLSVNNIQFKGMGSKGRARPDSGPARLGRSGFEAVPARTRRGAAYGHPEPGVVTDGAPRRHGGLRAVWGRQKTGPGASGWPGASRGKAIRGRSRARPRWLDCG